MRKQNINDRVSAFVSKSRIPHLQLQIWCEGETHKQSFGNAAAPNVDVFEIGSVGKTFTASLLAVLDGKGLVSLTDKVSKYKPELPFAEGITLFELATHTAGFPSHPFTGFVLNGEKAVNAFTEADYNHALQRLKAPLKTGKIAYSNFGMALLGNILAERTGMEYEAAVKEYLLHPLGMHDTHVSVSSYEPSRVATGYNGKGKPTSAFSWACFEPAGVWRSTTHDLMLFLQAHLGAQGDAWQSTLNRCASPIFHDVRGKRIGLAWQIAHRDNLGMIAWHNGQTFGQKSVIIFAPDRECALVMLSNKAPKLWHYLLPSRSIERLGLEILSLVSSDS